jgi:16S rRNA (guanine1207-N2)-methyltransferase
LDRNEVQVAGTSAQIASYSGVFASDRLDGGTEALVQAMQIEAGKRVLDLGCGTGLAALAASRRGAAAAGTDVSARAVASARATLNLNGYASATVHLCPGATAFAAGSFDTVITNPPFHRGHDLDFDVAQYFVEEAARVLGRDGALYLVANAFLDYRRWLEQHFTDVSIALENSRFRVWFARPSSSRG